VIVLQTKHQRRPTPSPPYRVRPIFWRWQSSQYIVWFKTK